MKCDVIIVGAGPAGFSFARSLAGTNLQIIIIDKLQEDVLANPAFDGRDIALTHNSVNILKKLGIHSRLPADEVSPLREARVVDGVSSWFLHFDYRKTGYDTLGYMVSNHLIRKALFEEAATLPNVRLMTGTTVDSVRLEEGGASVQLAGGETLETSLLIAADSRFSDTRRSAGIAAVMRDFGHTAIVCRMEHELPHQDIAYECFHYQRTLAVLPLAGNQSSIVITVPGYKARDIQLMEETRFNDSIQRQFNHRLGSMKLIGERFIYPLVSVYAERFASTRCALIGDAAVGMHPVTAHGYNLGLSGVDILAREILSALARGDSIASSRVLNAYERQHRRLSRPMYLATNTIVRLYTNDAVPARLARKLVLRLGNRASPIKHYLMNRLTAIRPGAEPASAWGKGVGV